MIWSLHNKENSNDISGFITTPAGDSLVFGKQAEILYSKKGNFTGGGDSIVWEKETNVSTLEFQEQYQQYKKQNKQNGLIGEFDTGESVNLLSLAFSQPGNPSLMGRYRISESLGLPYGPWSPMLDKPAVNLNHKGRYLQYQIFVHPVSYRNFPNVSITYSKENAGKNQSKGVSQHGGGDQQSGNTVSSLMQKNTQTPVDQNNPGTENEMNPQDKNKEENNTSPRQDEVQKSGLNNPAGNPSLPESKQESSQASSSDTQPSKLDDPLSNNNSELTAKPDTEKQSDPKQNKQEQNAQTTPPNPENEKKEESPAEETPKDDAVKSSSPSLPSAEAQASKPLQDGEENPNTGQGSGQKGAEDQNKDNDDQSGNASESSKPNSAGNSLDTRAETGENPEDSGGSGSPSPDEGGGKPALNQTAKANLNTGSTGSGNPNSAAPDKDKSAQGQKEKDALSPEQGNLAQSKGNKTPSNNPASSKQNNSSQNPQEESVPEPAAVSGEGQSINPDDQKKTAFGEIKGNDNSENPSMLDCEENTVPETLKPSGNLSMDSNKTSAPHSPAMGVMSPGAFKSWNNGSLSSGGSTSTSSVVENSKSKAIVIQSSAVIPQPAKRKWWIPLLLAALAAACYVYYVNRRKKISILQEMPPEEIPILPPEENKPLLLFREGAVPPQSGWEKLITFMPDTGPACLWGDKTVFIHQGQDVYEGVVPNMAEEMTLTVENRGVHKLARLDHPVLFNAFLGMSDQGLYVIEDYGSGYYHGEFFDFSRGGQEKKSQKMTIPKELTYIQRVFTNAGKLWIQGKCGDEPVIYYGYLRDGRIKNWHKDAIWGNGHGKLLTVSTGKEQSYAGLPVNSQGFLWLYRKDEAKQTAFKPVARAVYETDDFFLHTDPNRCIMMIPDPDQREMESHLFPRDIEGHFTGRFTVIVTLPKPSKLVSMKLVNGQVNFLGMDADQTSWILYRGHIGGLFKTNSQPESAHVMAGV